MGKSSLRELREHPTTLGTVRGLVTRIPRTMMAGVTRNPVFWGTFLVAFGLTSSMAFTENTGFRAGPCIFCSDCDLPCSIEVFSLFWWPYHLTNNEWVMVGCGPIGLSVGLAHHFLEFAMTVAWWIGVALMSAKLVTSTWERRGVICNPPNRRRYVLAFAGALFWMIAVSAHLRGIGYVVRHECIVPACHHDGLNPAFWWPFLIPGVDSPCGALYSVPLLFTASVLWWVLISCVLAKVMVIILSKSVQRSTEGRPESPRPCKRPKV